MLERMTVHPPNSHGKRYVTLADYGAKKWLLVKVTRDVIVIKTGGEKYWSSLGQPWKYAPVEFEIWMIQRNHLPEDFTWTPEIAQSVPVIKLIDFPKNS